MWARSHVQRVFRITLFILAKIGKQPKFVLYSCNGILCRNGYGKTILLDSKTWINLKSILKCWIEKPNSYDSTIYVPLHKSIKQQISHNSDYLWRGWCWRNGKQEYWGVGDALFPDVGVSYTEVSILYELIELRFIHFQFCRKKRGKREKCAQPPTVSSLYILSSSNTSGIIASR